MHNAQLDCAFFAWIFDYNKKLMGLLGAYVA